MLPKEILGLFGPSLSTQITNTLVARAIDDQVTSPESKVEVLMGEIYTSSAVIREICPKYIETVFDVPEGVEVSAFGGHWMLKGSVRALESARGMNARTGDALHEALRARLETDYGPAAAEAFVAATTERLE